MAVAITSIAGCRRVVEPNVVAWEGELMGAQGAFDPLQGSAAALSEGNRTVASIAISGAEDTLSYVWRIRRGDCRTPGAVVGGLASYPVLEPGSGGSASADAALSEGMLSGSFHAAVFRSGDEALVACGDLRPV
jgi:hypothetical protein